MDLPAQLGGESLVRPIVTVGRDPKFVSTAIFGPPALSFFKMRPSRSADRGTLTAIATLLLTASIES